MRQRLVWDVTQPPGKRWVKREDRSRRSRGVQIISDETEAFQSMADGKHYTSKSRYRAELKARGFEEYGESKRFEELSANERGSGVYTPGDATADIVQVMKERGDW